EFTLGGLFRVIKPAGTTGHPLPGTSRATLPTARVPNTSSSHSGNRSRELGSTLHHHGPSDHLPLCQTEHVEGTP
ncbi:MAG TPA: hypothetical protein PLA13_01775, partial [Microbacteriaceae bacterium]|nr:hypothetical protein [Microbacteriaceae bacterium]